MVDEVKMKRYLNILMSIHSNPFTVKVVFTVIAFAAFSCFVVMLELRDHMNRTLIGELEEKGQVIATMAAYSLNEPFKQGDEQAMAEIITDFMLSYEGLDYIIILNNNGQPKAHSFGTEIPGSLLAQRGPVDLSDAVITIDGERGKITDILVPLKGELGWIRVGLSHDSITNNIFYFSKLLILTTVILTVFGVAGALIVAQLVTKPIRELAAASRKITEGDLSQRVSIWGEDEIGRLGEAFNQMASGIEKYTREREALVRELKRNELIRQELLKKVITAQEDERKRISRELHDETSQSLTSLIIGLKLLEDENLDKKIRNSVSAMKVLASTTLKEVHRLAVELRPTVLDDMGLIPAIERFVKHYSANYNIDIDFHVLNKTESRLPGEAETALYRIVQESLTNIAKYAQAQNVSILLDIQEEWVKLIVEDDGGGFDIEDIEQSDDVHLGLAGMKERTLLLGGEFTIESSFGQGTTIFARIPLKRREIIEITDKIAFGR